MSDKQNKPTTVNKAETDWTYTVKKGDGLMAIVKKEFNLKNPKDAQEIKQRIELIMAQNDLKDMNKILVGDVLKLRFAEDNDNGEAGKLWTYRVKQGDGLMAIVRQAFDLKDPEDTKEIKRRVDLIVTQNNIKDMNKIKVGDNLTLRY